MTGKQISAACGRFLHSIDGTEPGFHEALDMGIGFIKVPF